MPQPGSPLRAGAAAVIEEKDGRLTYWALTHPSALPDFHHRLGFVLQVGTQPAGNTDLLRDAVRNPALVKFGIDRLCAEPALRADLRGRRVALLAHPASVTADLTHSLDALAALDDVRLTAAFGPQHGLRGDKQDNMVESPDFNDPRLGIPVFSLYGEVRRPTAAMLDTFDVLLVDLQDLGCRIYTFITTLRYVLEAGARLGKSVWVLDRPNPIGRPVEGLSLRPGWESFVGAGEMPMRHGLTLGEMGRWFMQRAAGSSVDYRVIEMAGWQPEAAPGFGWPLGERTWVNPSPNAPNLSMARCYPGTVMLEGTTLSEGRGTTRPLELFGAPDLDIDAIVARNAAARTRTGWRAAGCAPAGSNRRSTSTRASSARACRLTSKTARTITRPSSPWRLQALAFKALRNLRPEYDLWRDFAYEYEHDRLAIDLINGSELLRTWVDDRAAHARRPRHPHARRRTRVERAARRRAALSLTAVPAETLRRPRRRWRHQRRGYRARCGGTRPSTVLCEQHDLASHTSSASTKLVHGGLRYLEYYDFVLVRKSLLEREVLLASAPHLAWPLRFVLPHDSHLRPAWMIRAGLLLYDHLARRKHLPASRTIDLRRHPAGQPLDPRYRKGFEYSDGWVDDARLVVANAVDAHERGADVLTRTACVNLQRDGDGVDRDAARHDRRSERTVRARLVVNAAGPWVAEFLDSYTPTRARHHPRMIRGSHIVVRKLFDHDYRVHLPGPDGRIVFAVPYEGEFTLIGTTESEYTGDLAHPAIAADRAGLPARDGQPLFPARSRRAGRDLDVRGPAAAAGGLAGRSEERHARLRARLRSLGSAAAVDLRRQADDLPQAGGDGRRHDRARAAAMQRPRGPPQRRCRAATWRMATSSVSSR